MEGGRTRTGKLRPPKYGLLSDVASAVETRRAEDVYLVPVSIIHDQLQEVHQMAAEQTGATKTPEGLRWLAGYARAQRRPVGGVHVSFGEPLSLRAALSAANDPALDVRPSQTGEDVDRGGGLRGPPPGPAEDRVRGLRPHQPRDAGDADRAGGPRPARGA